MGRCRGNLFGVGIPEHQRTCGNLAGGNKLENSLHSQSAFYASGNCGNRHTEKIIFNRDNITLRQCGLGCVIQVNTFLNESSHNFFLLFFEIAPVFTPGIVG